MSTSPPPTNYSWSGTQLTYNLAPSVTGVNIKFQKDGESQWHTILDSPTSALTSCTLDPAIYGTKGTVCGATNTTSGGGWGSESCDPITNS